MKILLIILFGIWCEIIFLAGAVSHEKDLSRNFLETGDANAWFFEIKR